MNKFILPILSIALITVLLSGCKNKQKQNNETNVTTTQAEVSENENKETKILSSHDTIAIYAGTETQSCRGRTALCPNRCGHSGEIATFKIKKYNEYKKSEKYGDPQTETFRIMLKSSTGESDTSEEFTKQIRALKPGTEVHLVWNHVYISDKTSGINYPVRIIDTLEPVSVPANEN